MEMTLDEIISKNLKEEMQFECPEGHKVFLTWEKGRKKLACPICQQNPYKNTHTNVIPKPQGARRILAFDQSTKVSGWSVFDNDILVSGKIENIFLLTRYAFYYKIKIEN